MDRLVLTDAAWERMAPLIIGRSDQKGSTGRDNRMFVEGVLWIVRTGSPWRDLPEAFGIGTACSGGSADGMEHQGSLVADFRGNVR
jgi:putative transposase